LPSVGLFSLRGREKAIRVGIAHVCGMHPHPDVVAAGIVMGQNGCLVDFYNLDQQFLHVWQPPVGHCAETALLVGRVSMKSASWRFLALPNSELLFECRAAAVVTHVVTFLYCKMPLMGQVVSAWCASIDRGLGLFSGSTGASGIGATEASGQGTSGVCGGFRWGVDVPRGKRPLALWARVLV
jgi:hypothetical protein